MNKEKLAEHIDAIEAEVEILTKLDHPNIVKYYETYIDEKYIYLVMEFIGGGELFDKITQQENQVFTEDMAAHYMKKLFSALNHMHAKGIIHRDIKPENLVFDENGYLKLTDFGIAREWIPNTDNSNETSGTPGYMAPEVMCKNNHGIAADYFALGVIAWECMNGRRPYQGKSRKEIRDAILAKQAHIRKNEVADGWDVEAADFINKVCKHSSKFLILMLSSKTVSVSYTHLTLPTILLV